MRRVGGVPARQPGAAATLDMHDMADRNLTQHPLVRARSMPVATSPARAFLFSTADSARLGSSRASRAGCESSPLVAASNVADTGVSARIRTALLSGMMGCTQ